MIRRPPRSTQSRSSAASDVYKRQAGEFYDYEEAWKSVCIELRSALMNKSRPSEPGLYALPRSFPAAVTPVVEFDNETSDNFTIIDITARDRIGFLYQVTKTLYE